MVIYVQSTIALLVLILDIVAMIEVLSSSKRILNKVLWIIFILFLPLIGLIVYYFFGRNSQ